jgi:hypothetical protein
MDVGKLGTLVTHVIDSTIELAVIEFVIAHDVDNMWELKTTTLHEVSVGLCFTLSTSETFQVNIGVHAIVYLRMVVEVLGNHNVTTEDQYIVVLIILNVDVAEL